MSNVNINSRWAIMQIWDCQLFVSPAAMFGLKFWYMPFGSSFFLDLVNLIYNRIKVSLLSEESVAFYKKIMMYRKLWLFFDNSRHSVKASSRLWLCKSRLLPLNDYLPFGYQLCFFCTQEWFYLFWWEEEEDTFISLWWLLQFF